MQYIGFIDVLAYRFDQGIGAMPRIVPLVDSNDSTLVVIREEAVIIEEDGAPLWGATLGVTLVEEMGEPVWVIALTAQQSLQSSEH